MHPENPEILLAGTSNNAYLEGAGIFLTTDGGGSWEKVWAEGVQSVEFTASNPDIAYAGNPNAVYQSTDGGHRWRKVTLRDRGWGPPGVEAGFPIDFQVDPRNPSRLFANNYGGGNFLSEDGGQTWIVASTGYTGAQVRAIAVAPDNPAQVYAAARSGIFGSSDGGGEWVGLNYPPAGGLEWNLVAVDPDNSQHVFAANNWFSRILESHDGARSWRDTQAGVPEGKGWRSMAFAPSDPSIIYAGTAAFFSAGGFDGALPAAGILVSTSGGASWQAANDQTSQDASVAALAVDPGDAQRVYAAATNKGVLLSTDGGGTWQVSNQGLPQNPAVRAVAVDPANPDVVFAGLERRGLYRSTNAGGRWQAVAAGLPAEATITAIVFDLTNPEIVFVADLLSGLYRSDNGGASWAALNNGLRTRAINALALSGDGQHLYAATEGEGVFRLDLSGIPVSVSHARTMPTGFRLERNFPNPFNPETVIPYAVPRNGRVELRIFNILGQEIVTLVDDWRAAGSYAAVWDGTNHNGARVASGVYLYHLQEREFHAVRKMLLIR